MLSIHYIDPCKVSSFPTQQNSDHARTPPIKVCYSRLQRKEFSHASVISYQHAGGNLQYVRAFVNSYASKSPIASFYSVPDKREERLIITRPELWRKQYVLKLLSSGYLLRMIRILSSGIKEGKAYSAARFQIQKMCFKVRHPIVMTQPASPHLSAFKTST